MAEPNTAVAPKRALATVCELLEKSKAQIAAALPRHLTPERMIRIARTALQRTPDLLACDPMSLVGCIVQASQLGLECDGVLGQAYLVPFNNRKTGRKEAQLIVGYKGMIALSRRSGEVSRLAAYVVHQNDRFHFQLGSAARLDHEPNLADPGAPIAVYAILKLRDGGEDFEVIPWVKIEEKARQYGKPGSPWLSHTEEMARKTAIRAIFKRCPVSVEMQRAAVIDEQHESGVPQHFDSYGLEGAVSRTDQVLAQLGDGRAPGEVGPEDDSPPTAKQQRLLKTWFAQWSVEQVEAFAARHGVADAQKPTRSEAGRMLQALEDGDGDGPDDDAAERQAMQEVQ